MNGHDRERQVRKLLEAEGWWVSRAAGSLGDADLVAARAYTLAYGVQAIEPREETMVRELQLIEVKANKDGGPYKSFGPKDRAELSAAAKKAGASAWLAYWPARKPIRWIPENEWPPVDLGLTEEERT